MFVGAYACGWANTKFGENAWTQVWLVPTIGCLLVLAIFLAGFRARDANKEFTS
jgi:hypothetical protein